MKIKLAELLRVNGERRRLLSLLLAGGGIAALGSRKARAEEDGDTLRFPGDPPEH